MTVPAAALRRDVALSLGAAAFLGVALLLVVGAAAWGSRPEAWTAGIGVVTAGVASAVGTAAGVVLPPLAGLAAFRSAGRWSRRGDASAWASMGVGPGRAFVAAWPCWALAAALVLLLGWTVEPAAWRLVHRVKGSSAVAAAAWTRLEAGEHRVLPGGGGLRRVDGVVRLIDRTGTISASAAGLRPVQAGWEAAAVELRAPGGSWSAARVRLEPIAATANTTPASAWAQGPGELRARIREGDPGDRRTRRAGLVFHRRLAWPLALLPLSLGGWLLGWSPTPRARRPARAAVSLLVGLGAVLAVARAADILAGQAVLPGPAAGWMPAVAAVIWLAAVHGGRSR